ncbi:MAG: MerR family transcriptional regulator [Acidobacteriota bacterium]
MQVVTQRTGLSPHVLRVWERRHQVVSPIRTEGGHRLYSQEDVTRLSLLAELTRSGHRIGSLAALTLDQLQGLRREDVASTPAPLRRGFEEALQAVETMDRDGLTACLESLTSRHGAPRVLTEVIEPLMIEVGRCWHRGLLGPAQEHLASLEVRRLLEDLIRRQPSRPDSPGVVVGTLPGQHHELGALTAALTMAMHGWRTWYLGADLPPEELARAAERLGARAVAVSLKLAEAREQALGDVHVLREELDDEVELLCGGPLADELRDELSSSSIQVCEGLSELTDWLSRRSESSS